MPVFDAIFFSPHYDDAVLSAGNKIAELTRSHKNVLIVTVFTKGSRLTQPAAMDFLRRSGHTSSSALFTARKKENLAANSILAAKTVDLTYTDAGFRDQHGSYNSIFTQTLTETDCSLLPNLEKKITTILLRMAKPNCQIYAPLAIGNHVDHQLVFLATNHSWQPQFNWQLWYWEDIPYRHQTGSVLNRLTKVEPYLTGMIAETKFSKHPTVKTKAVACHQSQITELLNSGGYCPEYDAHFERFWHA